MGGYIVEFYMSVFNKTHDGCSKTMIKRKSRIFEDWMARWTERDS